MGKLNPQDAWAFCCGPEAAMRSRALKTNGLFWEHICPLCPGIKSLIFQMPFSDLKATSIYSEGQFLNWIVLSWALSDPPVLKLPHPLPRWKSNQEKWKGAGDIRDSLHLPVARASLFVFNSLEHRIAPCLACWRHFSNRIDLIWGNCLAFQSSFSSDSVGSGLSTTQHLNLQELLLWSDRNNSSVSFTKCQVWNVS